MPKGICVTSAGSWNIYASATVSLAEVRKAANSWKGNDEERRGNLEKACKKATTEIASRPIPSMLESSIISELDSEFEGVDWRAARRFAVRSSAIGEDSEELSAAGQNEARYRVVHLVEDSLLLTVK